MLLKMSSHGKCKNCQQSRFSLSEWEDSSKKSGSKKKHHHRHPDEKKSRVYALIAKVSKNTTVENHIHFDIGLGGSRVIDVSEDGSTFTFLRSGMYRIAFSGYVDLNSDVGGEFLFDKNYVKDDQLPFTRSPLISGQANVSTILPFYKGQSLSLGIKNLVLKRFKGSGDDGYPVISAGSQVEIYKVSDL